MACRHNHYLLPSFLTWGCRHRRWRCASLHSVGWAGRRRLGMGCSGCSLSMHVRWTVSNNWFSNHEKTKALLLLHLILCGADWFLIDAPSVLTKYEARNNRKVKPTSPHSNRGHRDLCKQIQKWLASCSLLIKDGSLDCMCDWPVAICNRLFAICPLHCISS